MKDRFAASLRRYLRRHAPDADLGPPAGHAPFQNPIIEGLKAQLPCSTDPAIGGLQGDGARGLLRFENGVVLDFNTDVVSPCVPKVRVSFSTKHVWQDFGDETIQGVVAKFGEHIATGGQSVKGTYAQKFLDALRAARPRSLYAIFWGIFEDDDVAI